MVRESKRPIVLSFTNKACENVRKRLADMGHGSGSKRYMPHIRQLLLRLQRNGCDVFVKESSMAPNRWFTKLYKG